MRESAKFKYISVKPKEARALSGGAEVGERGLVAAEAGGVGGYGADNDGPRAAEEARDALSIEDGAHDAPLADNRAGVGALGRDLVLRL